MQLALLVISGPDKGKKQSFNEFPISLGRSLDSEFQMNDIFVSRKHCTIYFDSTRYVVHDLKSYNGTILNNSVVTDSRTLSDGDILTVGSNELMIRISD